MSISISTQKKVTPLREGLPSSSFFFLSKTDLSFDFDQWLKCGFTRTLETLQ